MLHDLQRAFRQGLLAGDESRALAAIRADKLTPAERFEIYRNNVFGSLFEQSLVDKVLVFIAPIIIGGEGAKNPVEGKGVEKLSQATNLIRTRMESAGSDNLVSGYVAR